MVGSVKFGDWGPSWVDANGHTRALSLLSVGFRGWVESRRERAAAAPEPTMDIRLGQMDLGQLSIFRLLLMKVDELRDGRVR